MTIIYLIGKPGTGKYTIAKEIAKKDYRICDNQLINNPIFELLNYDGFGSIPEFAWDSIALVRNGVFDFLVKETQNNYILTNVLGENEGDHLLFKQVEELSDKRRSVFIPVKLLIEEEEHIRRIQNVERLKRYKSIDAQDVNSDLIEISHPNLLKLDVTNLSAQEASGKILEYVQTKTTITGGLK